MQSHPPPAKPPGDVFLLSSNNRETTLKAMATHPLGTRLQGTSSTYVPINSSQVCAPVLLSKNTSHNAPLDQDGAFVLVGIVEGDPMRSKELLHSGLHHRPLNGMAPLAPNNFELSDTCKPNVPQGHVASVKTGHAMCNSKTLSLWCTSSQAVI